MNSPNLKPVPQGRAIKLAYLQAPTAIPEMAIGADTRISIDQKVKLTLCDQGILVEQGTKTSLIPFTNVKVMMFL